VTEAVYRPPVCPSRILYHQKKQAYQRVKLRPNHRPKRCKPTTDWHTQAKETHYKRLTPVWASKVRHYSDEYNPSVRPHLDVKLRNDNYHPSALDNAAISTLELIKTCNNFNKRRRRSSVNMDSDDDDDSGEGDEMNDWGRTVMRRVMMMISEWLQLKQSNSSVCFILVIRTLYSMTHLGLIEV
jgi:hypothetical protein